MHRWEHLADKPFSSGGSVELVSEVVPEVTQEFTQVDTQVDTIAVHASHYKPWMGGPNCSNFVDGYCLSKTYYGERWEDWVETGVACISDWPKGTQVKAFGQTWTCVDRGGKIRYDDFLYYDGLPWIDFLTAYPQVAYGTIIDIEVEFP